MSENIEHENQPSQAPPIRAPNTPPHSSATHNEAPAGAADTQSDLGVCQISPKGSAWDSLRPKIPRSPHDGPPGMPLLCAVLLGLSAVLGLALYTHRTTPHPEAQRRQPRTTPAAASAPLRRSLGHERPAVHRARPAPRDLAAPHPRQAMPAGDAASPTPPPPALAIPQAPAPRPAAPGSAQEGGGEEQTPGGPFSP